MQISPEVAFRRPMTADSSYLDLWLKMSADVYVRRPDLFEVMISPEESLDRFWGIELNPLLQTSPKIFVLVRRPAKKEVVDVHGKKQTFRREPVCRRVRRHLLAAEVCKYSSKVSLPMGTRLRMAIERLHKKANRVLVARLVPLFRP